MTDNLLRLPAERQFAAELEALRAAERHPVPEGWKLSPRSVLTYIVGGRAGDTEITPKYIGNKRPVEIAVATLLTDRGLLFMGEPGTAKSWLSEHLAAAVAGDSTKVVQGTMGTSEEQIKYGWNYALLISNGPSLQALVKTPVYRAMEEGSVARVEEISRCMPEVQDALIGILSEKCIAIPELSAEVRAARGFSLIATANTRDRGVNDMSAALKRRFNIVVLPAPATAEAERAIVNTRVAQLSRHLHLHSTLPQEDAVAKIVTVFRELRAGQTEDGKEKLKSPSGVLSVAEAISTLVGSMALAASFGTGEVTDDCLASGLLGAVVRDEEKDAAVFQEYLDSVAKTREGWHGLYSACKSLL